jgi:hypothetical protein
MSQLIKPEQEIWLDIKMFNNEYQISNLGRVKSNDRKYLMKGKYPSIKKGKLLTIDKSTNYDRVQIIFDGQRNKYLVHRLVAIAFIPNDDKTKTQVNHLDGNKRNNNLDNLEWVTHGENMKHSYKELNRTLPNRKLTTEQIKEIRQIVGKTNTQIGLDYNVSNSTISEIKNNKRYRYEY